MSSGSSLLVLMEDWVVVEALAVVVGVAGAGVGIVMGVALVGVVVVGVLTCMSACKRVARVVGSVFARRVLMAVGSAAERVVKRADKSMGEGGGSDMMGRACW